MTQNDTSFKLLSALEICHAHVLTTDLFYGKRFLEHYSRFTIE
jgi:hypothetical protein